MPEDNPFQPPLRRRLAWFAGLWAASVLTLAAVAFLIRAWIGA
ncbi:DUF2474 domain-containing protein [Breoghania sp. L-A4]|nr:DUF2474 domain-containing protein [Breoghania sp. L-A4]AXS41936.1 DUF2474 domain-containing protein [Breoghania sp. L-A4]